VATVGGFPDNIKKLWMVHTTSPIKAINTLEGHTGTVMSLAFMSDNLLVSASDDKTAKEWIKSDANTWVEKRSITMASNVWVVKNNIAERQLIIGEYNKLHI
jgi:WD40 repeat protein